MIGIIRREMRAYFYSPAGYVFTAIFWLLGAAFFFLYNILAASADVTGLFGNLSYLFMLIVPLLTMRLFSEEKRQKTDMLFFCSPTPLTAVVLGKFLAAMLMLLIALLGTGVYLAILARRAALAWGLVGANYLGFLLLGGCYIAVGVLMSALTESQVTAAMLTLAANMLLQLAEMSSASLTTPYLPFLPSLLKLFSLNSRFSSMATGVIRPTDVGYFVVFAGVLLALTVYILARRRRTRR